MAVGKLAGKPEPFEREAYSLKEITERLEHWGGLLHSHDAGLTNCTLRRPEITRELDRWLDEFNELKGR